MATPSEFDNATFPLAREHLNDFIRRVEKNNPGLKGKLLEIGPQERSFVREIFAKMQVDTFDVVNDYNPTYVGDITKVNDFIEDGSYDCVVCMDVIEHTLNPFSTVNEIRRILKEGGLLLISAPLNCRIHGPIPDCWRFTEHGWKVLLKDYDIMEIDIFESPNRELFPLRYNILAKCNKNKNVNPEDIVFRYI